MKRYYLLIVICLFIFAQQAPVFAKGIPLSEESYSAVSMDSDTLFQINASTKTYSNATWVWSLFIPGVAQFILDEPDKGWLMLGSFTGVYFARMLAMFWFSPFYAPMFSGLFGGHFVLAAMIGIHIWSVIDAFQVNQMKMKSSFSKPSKSIALKFREKKVFL